MQPVIDMRTKYKDAFEKKHGVKLGFSSFFVKAAVQALKKFPMVNASIDGTDVVYHGYFDVGMAIGSERGLVVPIIRDADTLSLAEIEKQIAEFAARAKEGKITLEELNRAAPFPSPMAAYSAQCFPLPSSIRRKAPFSASTRLKIDPSPRMARWLFAR
jgi:pyruvate/2-oxoglutarate dehydrogenase complex dihydrolipoamide acyltransferase (E2) component